MVSASAIPRLPPVRPGAPTELAIPFEYQRRWLARPPALRRYVARFLAGDPDPADVTEDFAAVTVEGPARLGVFATDLATGSARLRAAFPVLRREFLSCEVLRHDPRCVRVHLACEGDNLGDFFGLVLATGRPVRFEEHHVLLVRDGLVAADQPWIDFSAIVKQLSGAR